MASRATHNPANKNTKRCPECGKHIELDALGRMRSHMAQGSFTEYCKGPKKQQVASFTTTQLPSEDPTWRRCRARDREEAIKRQRTMQRGKKNDEGYLERKRQRRLDNDYALHTEDSWGNDDLGWEGGEKSVRAKRAGHMGTNRRRH